MTCQHCCGANQLFDQKEAKKQLKHYEKKGLKKPTRLLVEAIRELGVQRGTLLDIGGGIGAIQLELFRSGLTAATDIDASEAYLQTAQQKATEQQVNEKVNYLKGDFTDLYLQLEPHDIVTLDKVICCYPDAKKLLDHSLEKSKRVYGLVYPLGGPVAQLFSRLGNLWLKYFKRTAFRSYIHEPEMVRRRIREHGFQQHFANVAFPWHVEVYVKRG